MKKATDEEIMASYLESKSIYIVAKRFNMCHQSVHERLQRLKISTFKNYLTDADKQKIRELYAEGFATVKKYLYIHRQTCTFV